MRDQVTGTTYSDGTPAVTMSYDAAGRPLEIGNAVATDAYAYDDAGQLAVETQSVAGHPAAMRTLTHSHDADGLRTGLVYPGGKVLAAGYTARGQLATMTFHGQPVATSTYRPNGQPIGTVYGNGAQRTLSYDAAGRLTGTGTNVGAATITGRGYALDAVGRRTGYVDETAANAVFSYDPAGQVLGGTVPVPGQPASVNTYAYDPEGNRTQSSTGIQPAPADPVTITGSTTYTANPLNQYTAITGNPNPTYDADGNLLSGLRSPLSVFTCTWNGENRMLSSTSANVAITDRRVENAYDALGRRVRKTVKFASTGAVIEDRYFIYDGWNVIEETIAPATGPVETAEAVWGTDLSGSAQGAGGVGGLLLRESSATGASYYHYDGNGNVTALTSGAGTVQAAYTYGPFGETLRAAGPLAQANPWRFSTKYQDEETGLLYYGYRFYNPTDGRWPSRDPIEEEGGVNLYGMLGNDAVNRIDLLGLADILVEMNRSYFEWDTVSSFTAKATAKGISACCKEVTGQTIELKQGEYSLVKQGDYFHGVKNYPIPEGSHTGNWSPSSTTSIRAIVSSINSGIVQNYDRAMTAYRQTLQNEGGNGAPNLLERIFGRIGQGGGPSAPGQITLYGIPTGEFGNNNILINPGGGFSGTRMHIGENCNWSRGCPIVGKNAQLRTSQITIYEGHVGKAVRLHNFRFEDSYEVAADLAELVLCVKKQLGRKPTIEVRIAQ